MNKWFFRTGNPVGLKNKNNKNACEKKVLNASVTKKKEKKK